VWSFVPPLRNPNEEKNFVPKKQRKELKRNKSRRLPYRFALLHRLILVNPSLIRPAAHAESHRIAAWMIGATAGTELRRISGTRRGHPQGAEL
jgi:hypothetical protein